MTSTKRRLDVAVGWPAGMYAGQRLRDLEAALRAATVDHKVPYDAEVTVKKSFFGGVSKLRFRWSA